MAPFLNADTPLSSSSLEPVFRLAQQEEQTVRYHIELSMTVRGKACQPTPDVQVYTTITAARYKY